MTQKKCDKAVNRCFWEFYFILDQYKTQEMCDRVVSKDSLLILYYPDKFEIQRKCDEAVDDSLASLKLIADWFVASRMITSLLLCEQMKIYSTLMKILEMSCFLVTKRMFLI